MTTEQTPYVDDQYITAESSEKNQAINQPLVGTVSINYCFQRQKGFAHTVKYFAQLLVKQNILPHNVTCYCDSTPLTYTVKLRFYVTVTVRKGGITTSQGSATFQVSCLWPWPALHPSIFHTLSSTWLDPHRQTDHS